MPREITYTLPAASQDLTGKQFGRWTVLKFICRKPYGKDTGHNQWLCVCSCGKSRARAVSGPSLLSGQSLSCGCLCVERARAANTKHGHTVFGKRHGLVATHGNVMNRCYNPNCGSYNAYGAKGIRVEPEWHMVENFIRDMGPTWNGGYNADGEEVSIDRISSLSNYGPGLCKWSTKIEQANNQCSNVPITALGRTMNIAQWSREINIGPVTLAGRLNAGWTDEECVTIPVCGRRPSTNRAADGERQSLILATIPGDSFIVDSRKEAATVQAVGSKMGIKIAKSRIDPILPQMWVTILRLGDKPNRVGYRPIKGFRESTKKISASAQ